MPETSVRCVLTINSGSSSVKFSLYRCDAAETRLASGLMDRIGLALGRFTATGASGQPLADETLSLPDHTAAFARLLAWLRAYPAAGDLDAIGHRIVHGGTENDAPRLVTPALMEELRALIPWAPAHLPHELAAITLLGREFPELPQVACFDTAFHRRRPRVSKLFPLPHRLLDDGVQRYGFHGLSYEYVLGELAREAGPQTADGRIIIAHLGNGASMAAIHHRQSQDTTMGFTPLGGLVMSTRPGDLDPGVLLYLLEVQRLTPAELRTLVGEQSGVLGVSGTTPDMRDLLAREASDPRAADAVALFVYQARKALGSLTAVLEGLDTLVFTGGIGEHAAPIRERICAGFDYLGVQLDPDRNAVGAPIISAGSRVTVRVIPTNEELIIARHTTRLLATRAAHEPSGSS
jgi:acetate kinase